MAKAISILLAAASATSLMWFSIMPDARDFCSTGGTFWPAYETQANYDAATRAAVKFCSVINY